VLQNLESSVCLPLRSLLPLAHDHDARGKMESQHNHRKEFCLPTILLLPCLIGRTYTQSSQWIWPSSDIALALARRHRWTSHPCRHRHRHPRPLHVLCDPGECCGCLPPLSLLPPTLDVLLLIYQAARSRGLQIFSPPPLSPIAAIPPTGARAYACARRLG